jgi:hypothetical protein
VNITDTKGFFQSKAIWGGILGLVASALSLAHYTLSAADQAAAVELITGIPAAIGAALAIYGRIVASQRIG